MPLSETQRTLLEINAARDRAEATLQSLNRAKSELESGDAGAGRQDVFREVAGRSSLDAAIAETRRVVDTLDRALKDASRGPWAAEVVGAAGR